MECYVRLVISSKSLTPDQISKKLGLSHDDSWKIGETRNNTSILETDNGLIIKSKKDKNSDLETHIIYLMELTENCKNNLEDFSKIPDCSVQVACAIYYSEEPPLSLEKEIINWISSIGASLDIDLYPIEAAQA